MSAPLLLAAASPSVAHDSACSQWGAHFEAGSTNTQNEELVRRATKLIRTGRVYRLSQDLHQGMPTFPFTQPLQLTPIPTRYVPEINGFRAVNTEVLDGELLQVGTQIDALGHVGRKTLDGAAEAVYFCGLKQSEVVDSRGLARLGVEKLKPLFTRGVLLDARRYLNGGEMLGEGRAITQTDIKSILRQQRMRIRRGDVVLIYTGWEDLWISDPTRYFSAEPGLDLSGAKYLASMQVAAVGADNWGVEANPVPNAPHAVSAPVHIELIANRGTPLLEDLRLGELAREQVYEFAFILAPLPFRGGSGSPIAPLAVR